MQCRTGCGACCIAPSIRDPLPGMPSGKPAGVRCVHLTEDLRCRIFGHADRPRACGDFLAEPDFCGHDRRSALDLLEAIEIATLPAPRHHRDTDAASSA